jgi:hypothetical protein
MVAFMYSIDSSSFSDFPFSCEVPGDILIDQAVVTGTHSSGKTTLLKDYGTKTEVLNEVTGYEIPSRFTAGYEYVEGLTIPVVIAPEAATFYANRIAKNKRVVTDQYTMADQIGMESIAKRLIIHANVVAAHLAHRLQPNLERPIAIVVSDRSQLDGHVYSSVRVPEEEQELIDIAAVAKATGAGVPSNYAGFPIPYRENARISAAESFSLAFMTNHKEVPLTASDYRSDDIAFRDAIAQRMTDYYKTVIGAERVITLSGNRIDRLDILSDSLRGIARSMIAYQEQY